MVWAGSRPPSEGVPRRLPGVVIEDLPDGWALVSWVDKAGWQCPDAVYETRWLQEVPAERFEALVNELRDSDWAGLPPGPPFRPLEPVPDFQVGTWVRWVGPLEEDLAWEVPEWAGWARDALGGVLRPSHPGVVSEVYEGGDLRIRWVDKVGELEGRIGVPRNLVVPISEEEAAQRAARLRLSGWGGLV